MIRKSTESDIEIITSIFDEARQTIKKLGIDQWQNGYPSADVLRDDISLAQSYCVEEDNTICGSFAIILTGEPTYEKIFNGEWITGNSNKNYTAIHRVAISVVKRGSGISGKIISFAESVAKSHGHDSLRIDTHQGNVVMRRMLEKNGFQYCGIIYLESGEERVAYEKIISHD